MILSSRKTKLDRSAKGDTATTQGSRSERALKGTIASFIQYALQIGLQALLVPLLLKAAGQETLGAYAVLMQAIGYLALLDLGFSISLSRFLAQAFGFEDGGARFSQVFATGRTCLLCTNMLFSAATILLASSVGKLFGLSADVESQAQTALYLLAVWSVCRTPIAVFGQALAATQNLAFRNFVTAAANVFRLVMSIVLVTLGLRLVGLMLSNLLAEMFDSVVCWRRYRHLYPERSPGWGIHDRHLFEAMIKFSLPVMLMDVARRLIYYTDNIVASILYGATAASIYYSTQMPAFFGWNLIMRVADNATPAIIEIYARRETRLLKDVFLRLHRYNLLMALPFALGVALLNKSLVQVWVGLGQYAGDVMTFSLAIYAGLVSLIHLNTAFILATDRIQTLSLFQLFEGFGNLVLSFVLGRWIGLPGIMLATMIASLPTVVYIQVHAQQELNVTITEFWHDCLRPSLAATSASGTVLIVLVFATDIKSLIGFIAVVGIFALACVGATWALGLGNPERSLIKAKLASRV